MNDEDMKLMKEHGTYVPTIIAGKYVEGKAKVPGYFPPQVAVKAAAIGPLIQGTAGRAYKAGVKIAFGTDAAVYPHGENAKEFGYMVEAGMPPLAVIGGDHAAALLKQDKDLGSISAGKFADLVAVPGNPLSRHQSDDQGQLRDERGRGLQAGDQPLPFVAAVNEGIAPGTSITACRVWCGSKACLCGFFPTPWQTSCFVKTLIWLI
jgi:imidazolonepropionase-like amidohydrolase